MTATVMGLPEWLAILIAVSGYVVVGAAFALLVIFASLKVEAWVRGRATFALDGPEMASSQERRAAEDLGYLGGVR